MEGKDWRCTKTAHSRYDHHFSADMVQVLIKAAFTIIPHGAVGRGHSEIRRALECDGFCWEILLRDDWKTYGSSKQTSSQHSAPGRLALTFSPGQGWFGPLCRARALRTESKL